MKAEMGRKLSKRQGYAPIQAAEKRDCGRLGYRRAKKDPGGGRGLRFASTAEKRWAYCAGARDRAGGAPCG